VRRMPRIIARSEVGSCASTRRAIGDHVADVGVAVEPSSLSVTCGASARLTHSTATGQETTAGSV
jgi:hypothetical protein